MRNVKYFNYFLGILFLAFLIGCGSENVINPVEEQASNLLKVGRTVVWADYVLYNSVVTPAKFKPESGNFDELYAIVYNDNPIRLISESKPGDQDYNGGRWHLNVFETDDPDDYIYSGAKSVDDLELNDFGSTLDYFECPLLPRKNH